MVISRSCFQGRLLQPYEWHFTKQTTHKTCNVWTLKRRKSFQPLFDWSGAWVSNFISTFHEDMSHRLPSINLLMGAALYGHEHYDNRVMNICNSVKEWIRNTLNVFFTLSNKANDDFFILWTLCWNVLGIFFYYVPVAVTCIPETLQY